MGKETHFTLGDMLKLAVTRAEQHSQHRRNVRIFTERNEALEEILENEKRGLLLHGEHRNGTHD